MYLHTHTQHRRANIVGLEYEVFGQVGGSVIRSEGLLGESLGMFEFRLG